ncbi:hypothetical protein LCGC14_2997370 [marine sediment metagenome]|uniref:PilZ domain-containing protein n=1 Tax=marine sediment metagenome TaxID=412755 RepID=A0A0F8Z9L3_9ZZZZ
MEEKRKHPRYKCMFPAKLIKSGDKLRLIERISIHDFSREGLKLKINFVSLKPGSGMELELYFPEKGESTSLIAEIAWTKGVENSMEVGLKIKKMDEETKNEILSWIAPSESRKKNKKK